MIRELAFIGGFVSLFASGAFARDESVLARVTVYWPGEGGYEACWNGARLRPGHCAVDPNKIPYGSKVLFPDVTCVAVDTGPAVVNRKAARLSGRNQRERSALVIDRFFESKEQALAWERRHPHFMTVRVVSGRAASPPRSRPIEQQQAIPATDIAQAVVQPTVAPTNPLPPIAWQEAAPPAVAARAIVTSAKRSMVSAPPSYHRRRFASGAADDTTVPPPDCRLLPVKRSRVA